MNSYLGVAVPAIISSEEALKLFAKFLDTVAQQEVGVVVIDDMPYGIFNLENIIADKESLSAFKEFLAIYSRAPDAPVGLVLVRDKEDTHED